MNYLSLRVPSSSGRGNLIAKGGIDLHPKKSLTFWGPRLRFTRNDNFLSLFFGKRIILDNVSLFSDKIHLMVKKRAKNIKQRFFMAKELRLSISLIVIWSLLAGIIFTYAAKELSARMEHGVFSFIAVFLGYVIIVIVLALFFTHRFIGPFERLKMEMKLVLAGNYNRRLSVRNSDDFYVRSFVLEVNRMLDELENKCFDKEGFRKTVDSGLLRVMALVEKENVSKEKLREALLSFHDKVESLLMRKGSGKV